MNAASAANAQTLKTMIVAVDQEDTAGTASLNRCEPTAICSFRKSALLVQVPKGVAADRDTAVRTITPTRTASRQMMNGFVEINMFIHLDPNQNSDEWMQLSPIYTHMHREWLRHAKSTSQYSLASLKVRDDWVLPGESPNVVTT